MKTIYIFIFALLLSGSAVAQLQTGSKFIGLNAGASITKEGSYSKTSSYEVAPSIGYFISNNLMVGLQGGYGSSITEQAMQIPIGTGYVGYANMVSQVKRTIFNAGIASRYYLPVSEKFSFFVESSSGYAQAKAVAKYESEHFSDPDQEGQPIGSGWGTPTGYSSSHQSQRQGMLYGNITPGMVFFATPRIGVELKASMVNYLYTSDGGSQVNAAFNLSNTNLGVGFYF